MSLTHLIKNGEYNITLHNSGDLIFDFKNYAEQFYVGAENFMEYLLVEASRKRDIAKLDMWYFAIVYLYRQSLELLLKSTLFQYIVNIEDRKKAIGCIRHDLAQGLELLLNSIPVVDKSQKHDAINWLTSFFADISRVDQEADMFRYPFGNNMKVLFERQTHISLVATQLNMKTAFSIMKDINEKGYSFIGNYNAYEPKLIIEGGSYYEQSVVGYKYADRKFYPYFSSYEEAAKHLENEIKENHNSVLFLPMCYLFRNAVELGLKRIILEDSHIPDVHRLIRNLHGSAFTLAVDGRFHLIKRDGFYFGTGMIPLAVKIFRAVVVVFIVIEILVCGVLLNGLRHLFIVHDLHRLFYRVIQKVVGVFFNVGASM